MNKKVYTVSTDSNLKLYVQGPGPKFSPNSGTLHPERRFDDEKLVQVIADMCNDAFRAGERAATYRIRKELGIEK